MVFSPHALGVDLGQQRDFSVIAVLTEAYWLTAEYAWNIGLPEQSGWVWPSQLPPSRVDEVRSLNYYRGSAIGRPPNPPLALLHLERLELRTPYPDVVKRIGEIIHTPPLRLDRTPLVVDATGVGLPVVEMMQQAGLGPTSVTITSGFTVIRDPDDGSFRVPKRDIVSTMAVLLEQRRLQIPRSLPTADLLTRELQEFKRTVTKVGNDTYAAERDRHDDMVMGLALVCWHREWINANFERGNAEARRPVSAN